MTPEPRYFHASVVVGNSIYIVWGKNIYDFTFDDILEWKMGPVSDSNMTGSKDETRTSAKDDTIRGSNRTQGSDSGFVSITTGTSFPAVSGSRLSGDRRMRLKCVFREEMRIISVSPVVGYSELVEKLSSSMDKTISESSMRMKKAILSRFGHHLTWKKLLCFLAIQTVPL